MWEESILSGKVWTPNFLHLKRCHALSGWRALSQHGAFLGTAGGGSLRTFAQQQAKSDLMVELEIDGCNMLLWISGWLGWRRKSGKMKVSTNWQNEGKGGEGSKGGPYLPGASEDRDVFKSSFGTLTDRSMENKKETIFELLRRSCLKSARSVKRERGDKEVVKPNKFWVL